MCQGQRDLNGPSGREKIVRIIAALHTEAILNSLDEANALLTAATMPPLYAGMPAEAALLKRLLNSSTNQHIVSSPQDDFHHNLPTAISSFIGRNAEVDDVLRRLAKTRLLTLTGAGTPRSSAPAECGQSRN